MSLEKDEKVYDIWSLKILLKNVFIWWSEEKYYEKTYGIWSDSP